MPGPASAPLRALRARWRAMSLASGWRFPSDWALPEIDAVCATVMREGVTDQALSGLGRARAAAGAGLAETLADLAALHAATQGSGGTRDAGQLALADVDATPTRFVRVTALAWADVALDQLAHTEVTDALTGLPTAAYLRTRLEELYQRARYDRVAAADRNVLVVLSIDLTRVTGWSRLTSMILAAEGMRAVFTAGESVAAIGTSVLVALADRAQGLGDRAVAVRREVHWRLQQDPDLACASVTVRIVRLRPSVPESCELLHELGRC
ncbi:hypothetical protein F8178_10650 [Haloechinothrix sp. LS1_15]|nr:hypothetical protein [Haloechinothrix sp. LS1_15]